MSRDSHVFEGDWKDSRGDREGRQIISPVSSGRWVSSNIAASGSGLKSKLTSAKAAAPAALFAKA